MRASLMMLDELTEKKVNDITNKVENIFKHLHTNNELESHILEKQICVVLNRDSFLSDVFWAKIIDRLEKYIKLAGYSIKVNVVNSPETKHIQTVENTYGYIIIGLVNINIIEELSYEKIPIVLMDYKTILYGYSHVRINNRAGVLKLAEKIKEFNHKNILMVFAERGYAASYDERYETYLEYFAKNIPEARIKNCIVNSESDILSKMMNITNMLEEYPKTSIIICHNDIIAIEIIKELEGKSYKIPKDISVVGFDNLEESSMCNPSLTTVNVPLNDLSQMAVDLLIRKIKDIEAVNIMAIIEPNLIERKSLMDLNNN